MDENMHFGEKYGRESNQLTLEPVIFSHVLYQLSYLGMPAGAASRRQSSGFIGGRPWAVQPCSREPIFPPSLSRALR